MDVKAEACLLLDGKASPNEDVFKREASSSIRGRVEPTISCLVGVHSEKAPNLLGRNVCYIVAGVLIRPSSDGEDHEILMMQEAKPSCRGSWYLPAGKMEKNETLVGPT